jgi:two-component system, NarL family, nitrate/nitrite response regulator NarL
MGLDEGVTERESDAADGWAAISRRVVTLRVRVFHQDELFADALGAVLEAEHFEVTSAESLADIVEMASTCDAVLIDMRADGALVAMQALSTRSPRVRVLGCIEGNDPRQVTAVKKAGAAGWISTGDGFDRLVHLLRQPSGKVAGKTPIDRGRTARAATSARDLHGLTAREAEVLDGLARGASTSTLASELRVSHATARTHVHSVLAKLGVHTRLEAVAYAIEHQLIDVDDLIDEIDRTSQATKIAQN